MSAFRNTEANLPQEVRFEFEREILDDESPDLSWLESDSGRYDDVEDAAERALYEAQDAKRLATYGDGWNMVGVRAKVTILVPIGGNCFTRYELTSAGLWGIESDSDESYFTEVYAEECAQLVNALKAIGTAAQSLQVAS